MRNCLLPGAFNLYAAESSSGVFVDASHARSLSLCIIDDQTCQ